LTRRRGREGRKSSFRFKCEKIPVSFFEIKVCFNWAGLLTVRVGKRDKDREVVGIKGSQGIPG
jgi:hypothetical protein